MKSYGLILNRYWTKPSSNWTQNYLQVSKILQNYIFNSSAKFRSVSIKTFRSWNFMVYYIGGNGRIFFNLCIDIHISTVLHTIMAHTWTNLTRYISWSHNLYDYLFIYIYLSFEEKRTIWITFLIEYSLYAVLQRFSTKCAFSFQINEIQN